MWSLARLGGIVPTVDPLGHHDEESLDRCLEATDELARAGWLVFAWTAASSLPPLLWALGRTDEAALALGACEASGVPPQPMETPPEFASWATGTDPQIAQLKTSGAKLTLPRLLQVIEGEAPLPA